MCSWVSVMYCGIVQDVWGDAVTYYSSFFVVLVVMWYSCVVVCGVLQYGGMVCYCTVVWFWVGWYNMLWYGIMQVVCCGGAGVVVMWCCGVILCFDVIFCCGMINGVVSCIVVWWIQCGVVSYCVVWHCRYIVFSKPVCVFLCYGLIWYVIWCSEMWCCLVQVVWRVVCGMAS